MDRQRVRERGRLREHRETERQTERETKRDRQRQKETERETERDRQREDDLTPKAGELHLPDASGGAVVERDEETGRQVVVLEQRVATDDLETGQGDAVHCVTHDQHVTWGNRPSPP